MKVLTIVGARPQFIKAASVSRELRKQCTEILVHTGQHYDYLMSEVFFDELGIPRPDYNLEVGSASHGKQTGAMLEKLDDLYQQEHPDWVLVYGDTNSTLAGALAAAKLCIPIAHVEAGLRSFNRAMPEEINRVLTDHISHLLLCPVATAIQNLAAEGITRGVYNVGDVMYDAILHNVGIATQYSGVLNELDLEPKQYVLATLHRPQNIDNIDNLCSILAAFNQVKETIIFPAHPRTRQAISQIKCVLKPHIRLIEPIGYLSMLVLEKNARVILTDSGGIQKEAYTLATPCITLREETEWVETLHGGWNVLVGKSQDRILAAVYDQQPKDQQKMLFGDGKASERIVQLLIGGQRT